MSRYRTPTRRSKRYVHEEDFHTAVHYARRYPHWVAELQIEPDTSKAITYEQDRVQTSNTYDPVQATAIRRAEIAKKVDMIDKLIHECADGMDKFLILGVCYGSTFKDPKSAGIPCEHAKYYDMRREFLCKLAERI